MSGPQRVVIALDVGGSAIKSGLVSADGRVAHQERAPIDSGGPAELIVATLQAAIERQLALLGRIGRTGLAGVALGFPGPFDYANGVCYIPAGQHKYEAIYGLNLRAELGARLGLDGLPIVFRNDAEAAIVGEARYGAGRGHDRLLGITLGTGLGAAFLDRGAPVRAGGRVPPNGELYAEPYRGAIADDTFSARGLRARLLAADPSAGDLAAAAAAAQAGSAALRAAFAEFGADLGAFLAPYVSAFGAEQVLVLGGLAHALDLFGPSLSAALPVPARPGALGADAALLGAANLLLA
jgi:glucokinase